MVRVSVCPSLTEGLSRSQMTPGQLLAVDHCKMLPLKPSHCFGIGRRNGSAVSSSQTQRLASELYSSYRKILRTEFEDHHNRRSFPCEMTELVPCLSISLRI